MLTSQKALSIYTSCLEQLKVFGEIEGRSITYLLLEDGHKINKMAIAMNKQVAIDETLLGHQITRLLDKEPIQYVLGFTYFRKHLFSLNQNVLIPRPETEEIIDLARSNCIEKPSILDVGTGSGCIAISLDLEIENSRVEALDISESALSLARENAANLKSSVNFRKVDFLSIRERHEKKFDIIVSNPPYIKEDEKKEMEENVLMFEPEIALFVSNASPMIFYEAIAKYGLNNLNTNGAIIVEINSFLGPKTMDVFKNHGYTQNNLIQDFNGNDRFIIAKK